MGPLPPGPMTAPIAVTGLSQIASAYDVLLCDVWGVIHNGRESWPGPCEALARFNREGGHVVLISNSPRPAKDVIAQLDGLGVPREAWKAFVTSGDATRAELSMTGNMILRNAETFSELYRTTVRTRVSYNILDAQYGTRVAQENAQDRALGQIADETVNRLSLYFSRDGAQTRAQAK